MRIGITGNKGFIGKHLHNTLGLEPEKFEIIPFERAYFEDTNKLDVFVRQCDVIVHLAALNRHEDEQVIYDTNIYLVRQLINALERTSSNPHVIISSSSQEEKDNLYGLSKKVGRELLAQWATKSDALFTGLLIPNVFGPFAKPFYNTVVATFSHQLVNNLNPTVNGNATINLIYVNELVTVIKNRIESKISDALFTIEATHQIGVTTLLNKLLYFKDEYQIKGCIPTLKNVFEINLFNTYRSYIDIKNHFPVLYEQHSDDRGSFVEIIRLGIGGQVSFSTTLPNVTRGNHFHTRKIERFSVIKGKAKIQMRKIDSDEVLEFYLDGDKPAYVDMPIWYTHNISNVGEDVLYTNFWINESYNPEDADTFFVKV